MDYSAQQLGTLAALRGLGFGEGTALYLAVRGPAHRSTLEDLFATPVQQPPCLGNRAAVSGLRMGFYEPGAVSPPALDFRIVGSCGKSSRRLITLARCGTPVCALFRISGYEPVGGTLLRGLALMPSDWVNGSDVEASIGTGCHRELVGPRNLAARPAAAASYITDLGHDSAQVRDARRELCMLFNIRAQDLARSSRFQILDGPPERDLFDEGELGGFRWEAFETLCAELVQRTPPEVPQLRYQLNIEISPEVFSCPSQVLTPVKHLHGLAPSEVGSQSKSGWTRELLERQDSREDPISKEARTELSRHCNLFLTCLSSLGPALVLATLREWGHAHTRDLGRIATSRVLRVSDELYRDLPEGAPVPPEGPSGLSDACARVGLDDFIVLTFFKDPRWFPGTRWYQTRNGLWTRNFSASPVWDELVKWLNDSLDNISIPDLRSQWDEASADPRAPVSKLWSRRLSLADHILSSGLSTREELSQKKRLKTAEISALVSEALRPAPTREHRVLNDCHLQGVFSSDVPVLAGHARPNLTDSDVRQAAQAALEELD